MELITKKDKDLINNALNKNNIQYDSNYIFHHSDVNRNNILDLKETSEAIDVIFRMQNMEPRKRNDFKINSEFLSLYDIQPKDNLYNINEFRQLNTDINAKIKEQNQTVESFVEGGYGGALNRPELIEGFTDKNKCCPQGFDLINGKCERVCVNCKYNNCNKHTQNIGQVYKYENNLKGLENKKINEDVIEYILSDIETQL